MTRSSTPGAKNPRDSAETQASAHSPNKQAEETKAKYSGKPVDVWAMGVLLYTLASGGTPPYQAADIEGLFDAIRRGHYDMPSSFSAELQGLIRAMLRMDPEKRLTIDEAAAHPFLQQEAAEDGRGSSNGGRVEEGAGGAADDPPPLPEAPPVSGFSALDRRRASC